ncbi:thioredoxin-like protein [Sphaerosporella brunnea]|uniref:Thioredoxin-like protein n=1 Tax=Sphaerosporella brunnea TaxID=1250544 RepID=A0A5J5EUP0_9PEZI|nr:thioredoxin-like protein [Sphaerosporella brunnea]
MPSPRRTKALLLALFSILAISLFMTYRSHNDASVGRKHLEQLKTFSSRSTSTVPEAEPAPAAAPEPPTAFPAAKVEIDKFLDAHTIVIFSKSYCPYCKRAKAVLLEQYKIIPPPFVVELDLRPDMADMQGRLKEMTGRGTVPNIVVAGTSIGGCDDIEKMATEKTLADTIRRHGGDKVKQVFVLKE